MLSDYERERAINGRRGAAIGRERDNRASVVSAGSFPERPRGEDRPRAGVGNPCGRPGGVHAAEADGAPAEAEDGRAARAQIVEDESRGEAVSGGFTLIFNLGASPNASQQPRAFGTLPKGGVCGVTR
jgi:hypothetical protein